MDVPHTPCTGAAMGQALGLGPLGPWAGWFVAAGLGSSSEAVGTLVLFLAQLVTVAPLSTFHITIQHLPKKWETWFNALLCISLPPGEWLHPGYNEPSQPLACAGPFLPTSCVRGKGVHLEQDTVLGVGSPFHSHDAAPPTLQGTGFPLGWEYEYRQTG